MPPSTAPAAPPHRSADWYRGATRWTQLTFVENDPQTLDTDFWIDVFRRTRSNATCISAGGYIAYYPSKVPLHYVSRHLGDTDPFGDLVEAARVLGMHVMARVDPHAIHKEAARAHPEWIAVDAEGNPRRHWAYPEVWVTCAYGSYAYDFMPDVIREITRDYDIDAIFANRWQGHGVCYCDQCRSRFRDASGHDLPVGPDVADPAWTGWLAWRKTILTELVVAWDDIVKAERPHASFIPNMSGSSLREFDLSLIKARCPFLTVDHQGRREKETVAMAGRDGKRIRAVFPDRPVILIASIGPEEPHRWKDAVTTGPEIESWLGNGIAHGMLPWFTKFNGRIVDSRWVEPVAEAFRLHERLEPVLSGMRPTAEIALLDPETTLRRYERKATGSAEDDDIGFYHALVEARLPFEMISDRMLTPDRLKPFKVLVLPNASCLSDGQCAQIADFVAGGGSLVAAHETSLRMESGDVRDDFGLGNVLGIARCGPLRGPLKNTYVTLDGTHPIAAGFGDAGRIIGGTHSIAVKAAEDALVPMLHVPDFPDLPMEEVYVRAEPEDPALVTRETPAGGRTAYFSWNIGGTLREAYAADHARLIANTLRWALGGPAEVEVSGPAVLDVALRSGDDEMAVCLFNMTNPMMMRGPIRRIFPVGRHEISVRLPAGKTTTGARLLVSGQDIAVEIKSGRAIVSLPGIDLMEVLLLRFNPV